MKLATSNIHSSSQKPMSKNYRFEINLKTMCCASCEVHEEILR